MSTNSIWKVIYAFRDGNKKQAWDGQQNATVLSATRDEDSIRTILINNGIGRPGATIDIISISAAGVPGGNTNILS